MYACWFLNYRCPQLVNASQPAGAKTVRKLWDLPMVLSAIPRTGVSHSDQVSPQKFEVWLDKSYFLFPHDNNPLISQVRILYLYWRKWDCPGSRLDWSCDFNPIENLWRELKQIIVDMEAATNLSDIAKRTSRTRKILGRKKKFLPAPTYPMPSRVEAVVVAEGDVTKY